MLFNVLLGFMGLPLLVIFILLCMKCIQCRRNIRDNHVAKKVLCVDAIDDNGNKRQVYLELKKVLALDFYRRQNLRFRDYIFFAHTIVPTGFIPVNPEFLEAYNAIVYNPKRNELAFYAKADFSN